MRDQLKIFVTKVITRFEREGFECNLGGASSGRGESGLRVEIPLEIVSLRDYPRLGSWEAMRFGLDIELSEKLPNYNTKVTHVGLP